MTIARVGVVAKQGLSAAAPHLVEVIGWLEGRGIETILEIDTKATSPTIPTAPSR